MKYEYHGTIVESGKPLGSILFKPVTEDKAAKPTEEAAPRKTVKKVKKVE